MLRHRELNDEIIIKKVGDMEVNFDNLRIKGYCI